MDCSTAVFPVHHQLLELAQNHVHVLILTSSVSDVIQPSHPLLSPSLLPSIFPSIRVFSSESAFPIRWPEYWSLSFSISPFNEYSGLISFRIDWLEFLAVEGTLKGLLQHHSSKTSILWHSAFFGRRQWHPTPIFRHPSAPKSKGAQPEWRNVMGGCDQDGTESGRTLRAGIILHLDHGNSFCESTCVMKWQRAVPIYTDSWESLGDQTNQPWRKSVLNIHWKDWCWSCSSNTLATWCEELTHWKRP